MTDQVSILHFLGTKGGVLEYFLSSIPDNLEDLSWIIERIINAFTIDETDPKTTKIIPAELLEKR